MMNDIESITNIKDFLRSCRAIATRKGHPELADDFAQEAYLHFAAGATSTVRQFFIDFIRKEYGRTGNRDGPTSRLRRNERRFAKSLDAPSGPGDDGLALHESIAAPERCPGSVDRAWGVGDCLTGSAALIYELYCEDEILQQDIADIFGVTASRVSQIVRSQIKPVLEAMHLCEEIGDLYRDDPYYSQLVVDWITL
jgi:hypothetical protein